MHVFHLFASDRKGSVAVIFALVTIPLAVAVGLAIDYSRAVAARENLQASLDSAVLAVSHEAAGMQQRELQAAVEGHLRGSLTKTGDNFEIGAVTAAVVEGTVVVDVEADFPTVMLPLVNMPTVGIKARAEALSSDNPLEIAMVLDTTGSMAPDMPKLREGAQTFVDIITAKGRNRNVKVALVPFVGAVNIGNTSEHEAWLDKAGDSAHAGQTIRGKWIAADLRPECDYEYTDGNESGDNGDNGDGAWLNRDVIWRVPLYALTELLGGGPAQAGTPYQTHKVGGCYHTNPNKISNWRLFQNLANVSWKGCVEARPEPYDIDDTPPDPASPNTLWVPYFWLDGLDKDVRTGGTTYRQGMNDYIPDDPIPNTDMATSDWGRAHSAIKYKNQFVPNADDVGPGTLGPNKSCPDPILPLTTNYSTLTARISGLMDFYDGGTNTVEGIAWGWRVLSPGAPFTEGRPYGQTRKIMVVFSDGGNGVGGDEGDDQHPNSSFITQYNSYGFARYGRFPQETRRSAEDYIDARMAAACTLVKNAGIDIYVVAFGVGGGGLTRLTNCASSGDHIFTVDRSSGSLELAFTTFARMISPLRLSR
jgi:Flp pilus assembly protein TadG